jgi:ribosomal protein S18
VRRIIFLFSLLPAILSAAADWKGELEGGFAAHIHIPETAIDIDDFLEVELTLQYPTDYEPDLDAVRMNLLKHSGLSEPPFALIREKVESLENEKLKIIFTLEPQLANLHFISLYNIPFAPVDNPEKEKINLYSEIFTITVSLPEIPRQFKGHPMGLLSLTERIPIAPNPETRRELLNNPDRLAKESARSQDIVAQKTLPWVQLMGLFLFALVAVAALMQPKRQTSKEKELKKQALSARTKAMNTLKTLDPKQPEQFYINVTETVRKFIEERYRIKATTQTTQEFLSEMTDRSEFNTETQMMLSDFLTSADRVKFAEHTPTQEDSQLALLNARQFIEHRQNFNSTKETRDTSIN